MAEPFVTHRYTRNSRGPGQDGMPVAIRSGRLVPCPKCSKPGQPRMRLDLGGPHAVRYVKGGLVDCVGDPVFRPKEGR